MSTWLEFYNSVRDPTWPHCAEEQDFSQLPWAIQQECLQVHGYVPGSFARASRRPQTVFPIRTATACQLKWTWSTIYLTQGTTASCHRTHNSRWLPGTFDFHNTPAKIQDRLRMLAGQWPSQGCEYCRDIESAGGASDRITNLDFPGILAPPELDQDPRAVHVTPRMLEVYFDNVCNLKCVYCGPHFSSLWDAENRQAGLPGLIKNPRQSQDRQQLFAWLQQHSKDLSVFNVLGGEPFFQPELEQLLDLFAQHPAPELKLMIFSNLMVRRNHLEKIVNRVRDLRDSHCIREFEITASLDCWGPSQEYVRYPLDLKVWESNFVYLLQQPWINLIINSTITPLTIKTLPDLLAKINRWNQTRTVHHYQNSVNEPSHLFIDMFGPIFQEDFDRALALKPSVTPEQKASRLYLQGIALQSASREPNTKEIARLFNFLNTLDQRRNTTWPQVFPWLVPEFARYNLIL